MPPIKVTKRRVYNNDQSVKHSCYPEEIQESSDFQYRIEKVLQTPTPPHGTKELFVRWECWPDKYNSWIKETDKYDVVD